MSTGSPERFYQNKSFLEGKLLKTPETGRPLAELTMITGGQEAAPQLQTIKIIILIKTDPQQYRSKECYCKCI
jgi:hypothetical protein